MIRYGTAGLCQQVVKNRDSSSRRYTANNPCWPLLLYETFEDVIAPHNYCRGTACIYLTTCIEPIEYRFADITVIYFDPEEQYEHRVC